METSKSALRALPDKTRALFERIRNAPGIEQYILVGGTALALRLQHRISEDLDFFITGKLKRAAINSVLQHLHDDGCKLTKLAAPLTTLQFAIDGNDADDYGQDWRVDGAKLTFFAKTLEPKAAQKHLERVLTHAPLSTLDAGRIKVATEKCIFSLKSQVLQERFLTRDLYDLKTLIDTNRYSIEQMFDEAGRLGANVEFIKERIVAGHVRKDDIGINGIHGERIDSASVLGWFREQINELERHIAEEAARKLKG